MAEQLRLSPCELNALLRRAFEALCLHALDYEDLGRQILWLEMHGLGGSAMMLDALPSLEKGGLPDFSPLIADGAAATIDAGGSSLIGFCDIAVDLAIGAACDISHTTTTISNIRQPEAILYGMSRAASCGFYAAASWSAVDSKLSGFAQIEPGALAPDVAMEGQTGDGAIYDLQLSLGARRKCTANSGCRNSASKFAG